MLRLRILFLLALMACGSNSQSSDIPDSEPSTDKGTLAPITTPVIELTNQIQDAWNGFTSQSSSEYPSSSLQIIGDSIIGFRAKYGDCSNFPHTLGDVQIFKWEYSAFVPIGNLEIEGPGEDSDWIQFLDVTEDGIPELIVQVFCYEYFTSVYSVGSQGIFELAQASYLRDGVLKKYVESCEPTCAEGGTEYYELVWNGLTFDEVLTDKDLPNVAGGNYAGKDLSSYNMSEWDWTGADLNGSNLRGANLTNSNLSGANLSDADLTGANLSGANLSGAKLGDANFSNANLEGADLRGAYTFFTNFSGANLLRSNIVGVNLAKANLYGATMPDGSLFVPDPNYDPMADGCDEYC